MDERAQKFEYLMMSESERDKYLKSQNVKPKEDVIKKPVKIIKQGQVCIHV